MGEKGNMVRGRAYAGAVRPVALIPEGTFTHYFAVRVGFFVRGDVSCAAAAVGDWF